jgi:ankyrin repeat protein
MHEEIALYLIQEAGADITATLHNGISILMISASRGMESVIRLLLDAGEDPFVDCELGCSAIDFAATAGHTELANLMKNYPRPARKAPTNTTESSDTTTAATGSLSHIKQLAAMNINIYEEPLKDNEIAGGIEFRKEIKYKCCSNPACGKTEKELGQPFAKCNRCRCVRYCGADCQREHWKVHKKSCRKPMC